MESVGFGSFRISEVRKIFRDITSAWELLVSPSIEIHGFELFLMDLAMAIPNLSDFK